MPDSESSDSETDTSISDSESSESDGLEDSSSSEEEETERIKIPDDYEPEGVENAWDKDKCCQWETNQRRHSVIRRSRRVSPVSKPKHQYDTHQTPSDIVSLVIDDTFLNRFILYTNEHGSNDEKLKTELEKIFGERRIPENERGRDLLRGFLGLKTYAGLMGVKNMHEAWSQKDPLKAYPQVQKIMSFRMYNRLRKHFRCTSNQELPTKNAVGYHPLQNVMWALQYLREKVQHLWIHPV